MIKWLNELPEWLFIVTLLVAMFGTTIFTLITIYVVHAIQAP